VMDAAVSDTTGGEAVVGPTLVERLQAEPDARRRLQLMGDATRETLRRLGPLDEVVRTAAAGDPELAALAREQDALKLRDIRRMVGFLSEVGTLRMSPKDAADVIWALSRSTGFYRTLTVDRGWSHSRAFDVLNDAIASAVLAD
jgi:hypothetical protein